ncbi:fimbriae assembly protein [Pectobacterium carotovorum subsp. carotovorum]|nr:fimbriae assembly protein [Pectobacterium carotovorum subsp. carotovorum]
MSEITPNDGEELALPLVAFAHDVRDVADIGDLFTRLKQPDVPVMSGGIAAARQWCELNVPPRILLVDLEGAHWPLPALEELLSVCGPTSQVIATGKEQDVGLYRALLQAGVVDYLVKPFTLDLLATTLAKCEGQQAGPEYARMGRTIAVVSASGGSGASTVAMGLSRLLSGERHLPVALVDFDRRNGDQLLLQGQTDDAGLAAVLETQELDTRLLQRAMLRVDTRLHLLAQKPELGELAPVDVDNVLNLGGALCRMFNQVIWDLPSSYPTGALDVLTYADLRIIVTELTLQDARNVRRVLNEIGDESEGQRLLLVHNQSRFATVAPLSRDQFEQFTGRKIDVVLPNAGHALAQSLTLGALNLAAAPAFQQGLRQLVDLACGVRARPAEKRWFSRWLKRA